MKKWATTLWRHMLRGWLAVQPAVLRTLVCGAALLTFGTLAAVVGYILIKGVGHLTPSLFAVTYNSVNVSLFPALVNTLTVTAVSLLIAAPLGIFSAIYLTEYAGRGNRFVAVVRVTAETLSGIPSIVYGLFGYLVFLVTLKWGYSLLAGSVTLAIMVLPVMMRATEEALKSVPDSFREGSFGLGAGRLRTVFCIVLPSAAPGILAGVILSIGRIVGETAVLLYTAGTVAQIPEDLMGAGRTLSVHMYALWNEGLNAEQSYATAVVLLVVVLLLNAASSAIAKRIRKGEG